jgi:hypothetical protein
VQVLKFTIPNKYLFNAAAVLVGLTVAAFMIRGVVVSDEVGPCADRYDAGVSFGYQRAGGQPLNIAELQGRLNGSDRGLLENARIVQTGAEAVPVALEVRLPRTAAAPRAEGQPRPGVAFQWSPARLKGAASACLGYSVFLPEGFEFASGGMLPGLVGAESPASAEAPAEKGFTTRLAWRADGILDVNARTSEFQDGANYPVDPDRIRLARGRWVDIEQEIVLNTPGEKDGILRVWVDGELRLDRWAMRFRDRAAGFAGVSAEIAFKPAFAGQPALKQDAQIRLSPFRLFAK